jgi:hypothetical protein
VHGGSWPSLQIQRLESSLLALRSLVDLNARSGDDDVVRELSRFLVVRSCGFLEQVTEECCREYLGSKSDRRSADFGASWLGRGRNPSSANLVALVGRFDAAWSSELEALMKDDDERLQRELSFLVDRRNKIAHGLSEGIGARKAIDLADMVREITDWFQLRLDPR